MFWQYRGLEVFNVWVDELLRNQAISSVQTFNVILALILLFTISFLVTAILRALVEELTRFASDPGQLLTQNQQWSLSLISECSRDKINK